MPPNPTEAAPGTSQPTIRNFLRRTIRESVASAMDIDLDDTSPSQESRKRERESDNDEAAVDESILGPDIPDRSLSESLVNNTSIVLDNNRRRRVSSDIQDSPGETSTPNAIVRQMREIREAIETSVDPETASTHEPTAQDSSSVSATLNIQNMVSGIVNITNQVIPERNQLQWDNQGLSDHPPPPPSPLPTPFPSVTGTSSAPSPLPTSFPSAPGTSSAVANTADPSDGIQSIMNVVRNKMDECAKSLQDILTNQLKEASERIDANRSDIDNNKGQLKQIWENAAQLWENHNLIRDQIQEEIHPHIEEIDSRINLQEARAVEAARIIDENNEAVNNCLGHVDRIEARVAQIGNQGELLQSILQRISILEDEKLKSQEIIDKLEDERQRNEDNETMRTVIIRGFRNPRGTGTRSRARNVLCAIGCEDILHTVQKTRFSGNDKHLRLTFPTQAALTDAVSWFSQGIKQIKDNGNDTGISFSVQTPHRFAAQRRALGEIGFRMKRREEISRYDFIIKRGQLWMRVHKPGHPTRLIPAPTEQHEAEAVPMDIQEASPSCSICMTEYDGQAQQVVLFCGHTFHRNCIRTSLAGSLKCPVCRATPDNVTDIAVANCDTCHNFAEVEDDEDVQPSWTLSSKCSHVHRLSCAEAYLSFRDCPFPAGPEELEIIQINPDMKGCHSCENGLDNPDVTDLLMYQINPNVETPEFISLGMNAPGRLPRRWPDNTLDIRQLMGNGARPRTPPDNRPPLSGANALPVEERRSHRTREQRRSRNDRSRSSRR